jgi:hypothetical protein
LHEKPEYDAWEKENDGAAFALVEAGLLVIDGAEELIVHV